MLVNPHVGDDIRQLFNQIYRKKREGPVYISGTVNFVDITKDTNPVEYVNNNLKSIRTCLTFIDMSIKLLEKM